MSSLERGQVHDESIEIDRIRGLDLSADRSQFRPRSVDRNAIPQPADHRDRTRAAWRVTGFVREQGRPELEPHIENACLEIFRHDSDDLVRHTAQRYGPADNI
jgi:hypothetical protein